MGLFEPTFLWIKVTRGATICCFIQIILALVISSFPIVRGFKKLLVLHWNPLHCVFLAENLTLLIVISLLVSAILILIGNSKKRNIIFIPALIIQVCSFALTVGAFFTIGIHYLSGEHARHSPFFHSFNSTTDSIDSSNDLDIFISLCVALVLQYIFSIFYFKSYEYLRVFRN